MPTRRGLHNDRPGVVSWYKTYRTVIGMAHNPSLSPAGVGYRRPVIGVVGELRPLAPIILGRRGRDLQQLGCWMLGKQAKQWDVAFLGGRDFGGLNMSLTPKLAWHVEMEARSRPVPEATLRDFFFFSAAGAVAFFPTAPSSPSRDKPSNRRSSKLGRPFCLIITRSRLFPLSSD